MLRDVSHETWKTLLHGSLSGELDKRESHPGKKLIDHLTGTAELAQKLVDRHGLNDLALNVALAAYTHDLGKVDLDFQKHLYGKGRGVEHSAPSSFFTLTQKQGEQSLFELFFSAEAVRRHHSQIDNWDVIYPYWTAHRGSLSKIGSDMKKLVPNWPSEIDPQEWRCFIDEIFDLDADEGLFHFYWLKLRTILSLLVAGDRMDAIKVKDIDFLEFPIHRSRVFKPREERKAMDAWRTEVAELCFKNVADVRQPGLFTLTLPTGAGKTNIGLKTAHLLAENLGYKTIIYALPFISIVEQNADFAKEVFDPEAVQEDHSLMLSSEKKEDELKDYGEPDSWKKAMRLFRYWGSPVVVTTMVQLWETIYNPRASATIDFHRLSRAVVLMDEPQGIDSRLWKGLGDTLKFIHEQWGTVFVLMTATQPQIVQGTELAPSVQFPFNRHRYRFLDGKYKLEELPSLLNEHIPFFKEKSGMVVVNTRKSAWECFKLLSPLLGDVPIFVLTRWMTSRHRRETLAKIKTLEQNGERHYLIATQVVEAGVDLDFDWVFRDLGPLDSLIQVAGRCNRSASREEGIVLVAELCNDKGSSFAKMVYDTVLLEQTKEFLVDKPCFDDREVSGIVDGYYRKLMKVVRQAPLWKNIMHGIWGEYVPLFVDKGYDVPVYVDHDGEIDLLLEKLRNLERNLENRERLKELQNKLQQYAIGISRPCLNAWRDRVGGFVGCGEEMLEFCGDDYCIIRRSGIGEGDDKIYHPIAGFHPYSETTEEERW